MFVDAMSKYTNCNRVDGSNVVSNDLHDFVPTWPMQSNGDQLHHVSLDGSDMVINYL